MWDYKFHNPIILTTAELIEQIAARFKLKQSEVLQALIRLRRNKFEDMQKELTDMLNELQLEEKKL